MPRGLLGRSRPLPHFGLTAAEVGKGGADLLPACGLRLSRLRTLHERRHLVVHEPHGAVLGEPGHFLDGAAGGLGKASVGAVARGFTEHGHEASVAYLAMIAVGEHLRLTTAGSLYSAAHNNIPRISAAFDRMLERYDVLAMPAAMHVAHEVAPEGLSPAEIAMRGWTMVGNTNVHNATGHPAISIPVAEHDGLPVGVMLVGRHGDDAKLVSIAQTLESTIGWKPARTPNPLG